MRNCDIFVVQIFYYVLIDSFWGFPGLIASPTSYTYTLVNIWKLAQMRKPKWLFVMKPLSWMLLFRNNESSQNGSQVVLPRIVVPNLFCSFGQMSSFNAILDFRLRPSVNLRRFVHLRSSTYTWANHCRSPRLNVYLGDCTTEQN